MVRVHVFFSVCVCVKRRRVFGIVGEGGYICEHPYNTPPVPVLYPSGPPT